MYKNFQKSTKYSFLASLCIVVFLFTFIGNTAYGGTITEVTIIGEVSGNISGIAVDGDGNYMYVAAGSNIREIDIKNESTTESAVNIANPYRVFLGISDNIYVTCAEGIYKSNKYGDNKSLILGSQAMGGSVADMDSNDNVYVMGNGENYRKIFKFDSNGNSIGSFQVRNTAYSLYEVAADSMGNMYVKCFGSDLSNNNAGYSYCIDKLDSDGNFIATIIRGDNSSDSNSNMHMAVDNNNNVYISKHEIESGKIIIYKVDSSGQMESYASYDYSQNIDGIAADDNGNIYFAEGNLVKKITVSEELKMDTTNPPNGTAGTPYSYTFMSIGGIGEKTYALTEGNLPAGLVLSQDGILSGIPTVVGTNKFAITATDSATPPNTSSAAVSLVVSHVPTYTLTYSASYGGYISGQTTQQIKSGESGSEVTAIPNSGYIFAGWDDGVGQVTRRETNVSGHKNITAVFFRQGVNPPIIPPAPPQPPAPQTTIPNNIVTLPSRGDTSGGSSSGSTSTSASNQAQFIATVTDGSNLNSISQLPLKISTGTDNIIRGELKITGDDAQRIIDELAKQNKKTADIVMSYSGGRLSELTASITNDTIMRLIRSSLGLRLSTPNGGVIIDTQAMENFWAHKGRLAGTGSTAGNDSQDDDLYFKFTEIKDTKMQEEINKRASQLLPNRNVQSLSPTVDIQTNMPYGSNVGVRFPIPTNERISPALDADLLSNTAAYTEHSNGINESQRFDRIEFVNGSPIGVIDKTDFSKFTIVRLSQKTSTEGSWENDEQGWKYIKNGEPVTGWNQIDGSWYLMGSDGIMKIGWEEVDDKWYYLNSDGTMARNTLIDGHTMNEDGVSID